MHQPPLKASENAKSSMSMSDKRPAKNSFAFGIGVDGGQIGSAGGPIRGHVNTVLIRVKHE